jgi:hypothetical protein
VGGGGGVLWGEYISHSVNLVFASFVTSIYLCLYMVIIGYTYKEYGNVVMKM